jgi:hypothetical protein
VWWCEGEGANVAAQADVACMRCTSAALGRGVVARGRGRRCSAWTEGWQCLMSDEGDAAVTVVSNTGEGGNVHSEVAPRTKVAKLNSDT